MVDDLKSELSGCFEDAVVAMLVPSRKYDAICLHKALTVSAQINSILEKARIKVITGPVGMMDKTYKRSCTKFPIYAQAYLHLADFPLICSPGWA